MTEPHASRMLLADAEMTIWRFAAELPTWTEKPSLTYDCAGERACRDCGKDLDTLCPLLALAPMLALVGAAGNGDSHAPDGDA